MSISPQDMAAAFQERFSDPPTHIVRAPGRVNLIGEHTDYNDGFVLPMAIDRDVMIALRPRDDRQVRVYLHDYNDLCYTFDLDSLQHGNDKSPGEYVKGVAWALQSEGYVLKGWEGVLRGDVPIGAGLSSSAALEMATARAFYAVSGFDWYPPKIALLGQKTENQWMGVNSGIMDQMISAAGEAGTALLIDCRSLATEPAPLPPGTVVVVLDTGTRRGLVGSAYNERRQQCEDAAHYFGVKALRDVDETTFQARAGNLDDVTMRRARHIITENLRTLAARDAMQAADPVKMGALMDGSHVSMRDDFEISTDALNAIVRIARQQPGCYGARMTGGGFGGCGVALIDAAHVERFVQAVSESYAQATPHTPQLYVCYPSNGAGDTAWSE